MCLIILCESFLFVVRIEAHNKNKYNSCVVFSKVATLFNALIVLLFKPNKL